MVNTVAVGVTVKYPDVRVMHMAYTEGTGVAPQTLAPHKNVIVYFCTNTDGWAWPFVPYTQTKVTKEIIDGWVDKGSYVYVWDYVTNFSYALLPLPNMKVVAENIQFFAEKNVKGLMMEGNMSAGAERGTLRSWVWAKLLWDPTLDSQELIREFNTYCADNNDKLPFSRRHWPNMGMLDFLDLLASEGVDPRNMHCPADKWKPGSIAYWWTQWYGRKMNASDHIGGKPPVGIDPEAPYSYYWWVKMYWDYNEQTGVLRPATLKSWKLSEVRYPSRLIPYTCFFRLTTYDDRMPHGREPSSEMITNAGMIYNPGHGHQSGFLDGRAAWVPMEDVTGPRAYVSDPNPTHGRGCYDLDWTKDGVRGFDTQ